jgi:hypothetical protein
MAHDIRSFPLPSLNEQLEIVERHSLSTLLFCPDSWALRHRFINQETGEVIRARCNSWSCLYCGPRKVDQWRQLVKAAEPTLFLTLTKAGHTVEECARALTTFLQYLRRGSKGRGPNHKGVRMAYPVEYFAVLERHSDFERVGFHWHLLLRGVERIPHDILKEAWRSATHGASYIVHIEAVKRPHVIGYVTKYLMKSLSQSEKGVHLVQCERYVYTRDEQGKTGRKKKRRLVEVVSSARRIRYSRNFFPESVADLRTRLFADVEETAMEKGDSEDGKAVENKHPPRSSWVLHEQEELSDDLEEQMRWHREALVEALAQARDGKNNLSRRVISMWAYQRSEMMKGRVVHG